MRRGEWMESIKKTFQRSSPFSHPSNYRGQEKCISPTYLLCLLPKFSLQRGVMGTSAWSAEDSSIAASPSWLKAGGDPKSEALSRFKRVMFGLAGWQFTNCLGKGVIIKGALSDMVTSLHAAQWAGWLLKFLPIETSCPPNLIFHSCYWQRKFHTKCSPVTHSGVTALLMTLATPGWVMHLLGQLPGSHKLMVWCYQSSCHFPLFQSAR